MKWAGCVRCNNDYCTINNLELRGLGNVFLVTSVIIPFVLHICSSRSVVKLPEKAAYTPRQTDTSKLNKKWCLKGRVKFSPPV